MNQESRKETQIIEVILQKTKYNSCHGCLFLQIEDQNRECLKPSFISSCRIAGSKINYIYVIKEPQDEL